MSSEELNGGMNNFGTNEKKKNGGLVFFIVLLVIAVLGGAGYFGYKYYMSNNTPRAKFVKVMKSYLEKNEYANLENVKKTFKDGYTMNSTNAFKLDVDGESLFSGNFKLNSIKNDKENYFDLSLLDSDNKDLIKAMAYSKDDKVYLKLDEVFDKFYYTKIDTNVNDYTDVLETLKESYVKIIKDFFTEDKFTSSKENGTEKITVALTEKEAAELTIKFYEEAKNNEKLLNLFASEELPIDDVKESLDEQITDLKDEMSTYTDDKVVTYNIYINKNVLTKQELLIEDMVLTITGETSGDITLTNAGKTYVTGKYDKESVKLNITDEDTTMDFTINYKEEFKDNKLTGTYKVVVEVTSDGSKAVVTVDSSVDITKENTMPSVDLSNAKDFNDMTDEEMSNIYTKIYPLLEPIMGSYDSDLYDDDYDYNCIDGTNCVYQEALDY